MTNQMARERPGWGDPLTSDMDSTVDADMKRNDALPNMATVL
jgi:hypothetical protein